jgi:hypothetical protein
VSDNRLSAPIRIVVVARRWVTDPLSPVLLLAPGAVLAAAQASLLTWAVLGGLAGYALSGSV